METAKAQTGESAAWVESQKIDYTAFSVGESPQQFDGQAKIYQWDEDFGDVGPKFEELELELFGDPETRHERAGLDFSKYVMPHISYLVSKKATDIRQNRRN